MQKQPELLVLSLSVGEEPWNTIELEGQEKTWMNRARLQGIKVLRYRGRNLQDSDLEKAKLLIKKAQNHQDLASLNPIAKLPLAQHLLGPVRPVKINPGRGSEFISNYIQRQLEIGGGSLKNDVLELSSPEGFEFIGLKTLLAFNYVLRNFSFDYLVRTNSSTFIDVNALTNYVSSLSKNETLLGYPVRFGKIKFPSGALYMIHRSWVERLVENQSKWRHEYMDDLALGVLLHRLGGSISKELERFDFPISETNVFEALSGRSKTNFSFRCKSDKPEITIERMRILDDLLYP